MLHPRTKLHPLEYRVFCALKNHFGDALHGKRLLVACSGGGDSVALALVMHGIKKRLGFEITLAHVHHGPSRDPKTERARLRALRFVKKLASDLELEFASPAPSIVELRSEDDLRKFRHKALEVLRIEGECALTVLAHHADDLFETRLIRLIRGTGPQGLKAMSLHERNLLRPFLTESRATLIEYLEQRKQKWLNDPTNKSYEPLRNWLRLRWLKELEKKRPGAVQAFRRSLELLVQDHDQNAPDHKPHFLAQSEAIGRDFFCKLPQNEQRRLVASYLRNSGLKNFTEKHISEIVKRLDSPRKVFTFHLLRARWEINAEQIRVVIENGS